MSITETRDDRRSRKTSELERAMAVAHRAVARYPLDADFPELLVARGLVRMGELYTALRERQRAVASVDHVAEVAGLTAALTSSRDKVREMMRRQARLETKIEQAIELMLAMLEKKDDRVSDHPEWVRELGKLSGASDE